MKTDNNIPQLLDVIPDYPGIRVMHFADHMTKLVKETAKLCIQREYEYQIQCTNEPLPKEIKAMYPQANIKTQHISLSQPRYHRQAKMYDFIFVETDVEEIPRFLKILYSAMKNAANVFVLLDRSQENREEEWRMWMEKNYYVAYSAFDLNDETRVISAKKMHGWGGQRGSKH